MTIQECVEFLAKKKYIVLHKGRYVLTALFNLEVHGLDVGITVVDNKDIVIKGVTETTDWIKDYQQFIMAVPIPKYSTNSRGQTYEIGRATKPGRDAYKKARMSGVSNDELLAKARAYYRGGQYRIKVENFFVDEHWRSEDIGESNSRSTDGKFITRPDLG